MLARRRRRSGREAGFTYVGLIVLVAIIGLVGAATLKVDALLRRAAAEEELLEIGAAFSAALTSYAQATPRGQPQQPPSLAELLRDPRVPGVRRHLRKIFVDPITGKAEWGIVWLNKGSGTDGSGGSGVVAVYSLSQAKPLKIANFDVRFQNFESREHISDWKFGVTGQGVAQGQPPGPGQPGQPGQPAQPGQPGQPGQPAQPGQLGQPGQPVEAPAPDQAEPQPSLFPGRGAPATTNPAPLDPPPAPPPAAPPPENAAAAPAEPPPSEASSSGDDDKDNQEKKDNKAEQDGDKAARERGRH